MMDDAELLRAYAETRSETAFAGFVERRVGFVYAAALRMVAGNAHTAQDVTQAVFVLVANKAAALARHERLAGWLHTTACNVSRQTMRAARRRAAREQEAARMSEIENDGGDHCGDVRHNGADLETRAPGHVPDSDRLLPMLDAALGALREGEREAVLLRYFEGRGFAEIGGALKMSEDAARMRVARAVGKMRAAFARRGVTSSAAALGALMSAEAAQAAPAGLASSVSAGAMAAGGAAVTTATTINTFLAFMSSTKITTAAIVGLLIAVGGAFYGVQSERFASAALAQARRENVKLVAQLRESEKQNAGASAAAARAEREAATQAFLADHPEVREKGTAWAKALAAKGLFRISREMNLSPEQNARLIEILNSGGATFTSDAPGYGDVTLNFGSRRPGSNAKRELSVLLGEEGIERFRQLDELDDAGEGFIRGLGNALYFTDTPLTSQQARSLEKIASDLEKKHTGITDPQARWSVLVEQAKPILMAEQMRALVAAGDRCIWKSVSQKWQNDYNEARVVVTEKNPSKSE